MVNAIHVFTMVSNAVSLSYIVSVQYLGFMLVTRATMLVFRDNKGLFRHTVLSNTISYENVHRTILNFYMRCSADNNL